MTLTLEQFKAHINEIRKLDRDIERIHKAFRILDPDFGGFRIGRFETAMLDLLKSAMGDEHDWIAYWVYDLDWGKNWKPQSVTEKDGSSVRMKTAEDLYKYLIKNKNQNK